MKGSTTRSNTLRRLEIYLYFLSTPDLDFQPFQPRPLQTPEQVREKVKLRPWAEGDAPPDSQWEEPSMSDIADGLRYLAAVETEQRLQQGEQSWWSFLAYAADRIDGTLPKGSGGRPRTGVRKSMAQLYIGARVYRWRRVLNDKKYDPGKARRGKWPLQLKRWGIDGPTSPDRAAEGIVKRECEALEGVTLADRSVSQYADIFRDHCREGFGYLGAIVSAGTEPEEAARALKAAYNRHCVSVNKSWREMSPPGRDSP